MPLRFNKGRYDFWLDTGWGCGLIRMDARSGDVVEGGAPIFNRFLGQNLLEVFSKGHYEMQPLGKVERQAALW